MTSAFLPTQPQSRHTWTHRASRCAHDIPFRRSLRNRPNRPSSTVTAYTAVLILLLQLLFRRARVYALTGEEILAPRVKSRPAPRRRKKIQRIHQEVDLSRLGTLRFELLFSASGACFGSPSDSHCHSLTIRFSFAPCPYCSGYQRFRPAVTSSLLHHSLPFLPPKTSIVTHRLSSPYPRCLVAPYLLHHRRHHGDLTEQQGRLQVPQAVKVQQCYSTSSWYVIPIPTLAFLSSFTTLGHC